MRVGIVNDVRAAAEALRRIVDRLTGHTVAWIAADGVEAVAQARRDRPDLILMDLVMPHMDGVEATRRIMAESPCAILIVTATVSGNIALVYEAMGHGALDAVDTPLLGPGSAAAGVTALEEKIRTIAKIVGGAATPARPVPQPSLATRLLVVGASTGGPNALSELVRALPHDWNVATLVVQHVDAAFAPGLAQWLGERTGRRVVIAEPGQHPQAGVVAIAGTNDHCVLTPAGTIAYHAEPRDVFFRPSVDIFFESVADHWSHPGAAALLTGMGRDGARGLLALRARGWLTLAQDEASSIVWSMPKAAIEAGAACEVLPIDRMAALLRERLGVR